MKTRKTLFYGKFMVFGIAGMIAFTFLMMWLWNWLVPEVFNGPVLTYWQTLGLLVLSKILFSGIGKGSSHKSRHSRYHDCRDSDRWKKKFEAKMNGKTENTESDGDVVVTE